MSSPLVVPAGGLAAHHSRIAVDGATNIKPAGDTRPNVRSMLKALGPGLTNTAAPRAGM